MRATRNLSATTSLDPGIPTVLHAILTTMMAAWPWAMPRLPTALHTRGRPRLTSSCINVGYQESQGPSLKSHSHYPCTLSSLETKPIQHLSASMIGRIMPLPHTQDVTVLIPGTCEHGALQMGIRILKWKWSLDYLGGPNVPTGVPTRERGRQETEKAL